MEKRIKTLDGKTIYGTYTHASDKILIIFVHGLTGHQNEHIFYNGAKFFTAQGYSTFRFDLYGGGNNARSIRDASLALHTKDLDTVVRYFSKKFKSIILIGHSFGGPTILRADLRRVSAIMLWDPSEKNSEKGFLKSVKYEKSIGCYAGKWNFEPLMSKQQVRDITHLPSAKVLVSGIHRPICIIAAGKGTLTQGCKEYFRHANPPKKLIVIGGATHCFDEEGTEKELFRQTLRFLTTNS